jgi:hypothetical protein
MISRALDEGSRSKTKLRPSYLTLNELRKAHRHFFIDVPYEEISYTPVVSTNEAIVRGYLKIPFTDYYLSNLSRLLNEFHDKLLLEYTPKQIYTVGNDRL